MLTGVDGERQQLRRGDGSGRRGGDGVVVGDHGRWLDGEGVRGFGESRGGQRGFDGAVEGGKGIDRGQLPGTVD